MVTIATNGALFVLGGLTIADACHGYWGSAVFTMAIALFIGVSKPA